MKDALKGIGVFAGGLVFVAISALIYTKVSRWAGGIYALPTEPFTVETIENVPCDQPCVGEKHEYTVQIKP